MDRIPISSDNCGQRDLRGNIRELTMRWLSSDPIRVGDFVLPLRPVVGVLAAVVVLMGINALLDDDCDRAEHGLARPEPGGATGYPRPADRYPAVASGEAGYRPNPSAQSRVSWQRDGAGAAPVPIDDAPWGAAAFFGGPHFTPGTNGYPPDDWVGGDQPPQAFRGDRPFGYRGAAPAPAAYHGYRFRDEENPTDQRSGYWADPDAYRFRPLSDQERERLHEDAAERLMAPYVGAPSLYNDLTGSYGDVPAWQSAPERPDVSRTW